MCNRIYGPAGTDRFSGQSLRYTCLIKEKEGGNMELLTWVFTICGAATLARGFLAVVDALEKE